jgi:hypothetical protein
VRYYNDPLFPPDGDVEGCPSGVAGRLECSEQVLDTFYTMFQTTYGRAPVFGELMAALYIEELGLISSEDSAKQAMGNNFVNSCGSGCSRSGLITWLSSKQGWYRYGTANGANVTGLINRANDANAQSISQAIVGAGVNWSGACTTNVDIPCDWGNWAYNTSGYNNIRYGSQSVVYYRIWQRWDDYHSYKTIGTLDQKARCDNGLTNDNNRVPSDWWTDYIFAIVTYNQDIALSQSSTYRACNNHVSSSPRPNWLPVSEDGVVDLRYEPGTYNHPVWPME